MGDLTFLVSKQRLDSPEMSGSVHSGSRQSIVSVQSSPHHFEPFSKSFKQVVFLFLENQFFQERQQVEEG